MLYVIKTLGAGMYLVVGGLVLLAVCLAFQAVDVRAETGLVKSSNQRLGFLDVQRVIRESQASKRIRPEIDKLRREFQQQVSEQERKLRQAEQELARQRVLLAPEAFAKKRRLFSVEARKVQKSVRQRKSELDRVISGTNNEILKNLIVVAKEVAKKRKLSVLMEKRFVFLSHVSLDVTNEIILRLNKRLPTVKIMSKKPKKGSKKGNK